MKRAILLLALAMIAATPAAAPESAPSSLVDITKLTCKDLRDASPLDRSAVVMFYWGYAAAKANATTFRTGLLKNATTALIRECDTNESETILSAMSRINVKAF